MSRDASRPARRGTVLSSGRDPDFANRDDAGPATAEKQRVHHPSGFARRDWWSILKRTASQMGEDNVTLIAAGVAFYSLLALFPGIAAMVMLYGFVANPADIGGHLDLLEGLVPPDAFSLIESQVSQITRGGGTALGLASIVSLLLALWSSKAGVSALMTGLNMVYGEPNRRGLIEGLALAVGLTFVLMLVVLIGFAVIVMAPIIIGLLPLGWLGETLAAVLRWPIGFCIIVLTLGLLYRIGPSRADARMPWITVGAVVSGVVWILASGVFSFYVANFGSYNETYGSLGAVVALMMWFWLSAVVVLAGAELNAEMERQTAADTTTGPAKPMGERGAAMADTVATDE